MIRFDTNGSGIWHAAGCNGTKYALIPWGSLRKLYASVGGVWDAVDLGIVGSVGEAHAVAASHAESTPCTHDDPWTFCPVHDGVTR